MRIRRLNPALAGEGAALPPAENLRALYNIELEVLGERIRRARIDRKVSQRDLTAGLFTSAYLSSLELGKTRPTYHTLVELSNRLEKSLDYFLRPVGGLLDSSRMVDNDYLKILQARQALMLAELAVARTTVLDNQAEADNALDQVNRQSVRLSELERAEYYYLLGRRLHSAGSSEATTTLEQARQQLEQVRSGERSGDSNRLQKLQWLKLTALTNLALGEVYLSKEDRVMQALAQFEQGLTILKQSLSARPINSDSSPADTLELPNETEPGIDTSESQTFDRLSWRLLANVARCYLRLNDRDQSLLANREAIKIALDYNEGLTFSPGLTQLDRLTANYYRQARLYGEQGDFQLAGLQIGHALQLCKQSEDGLNLLETLSDLSYLELNAGQYEAAEKALNQLLALLGSQPSNNQYSNIWLRAQVTQVQLRFKQNRLDEAATIIERVIGQTHDYSTVDWLLYQTAAEVQSALGKKEVAKTFYQKALAALSTTSSSSGPSNLQIADLYYSYGQQLREWGEIEGAFEYLEKAYKLRQS